MSRSKFKKPANCICPGRWVDKKSRWGVIERGENPDWKKNSSTLKCLECGWIWKSRCKYVLNLPDHKVRSFAGMTDQDILDRLIEGDLRMNIQTGQDVESWHPTQKKWTSLQILERSEPNGHTGTYHFVKICKGGKQKKIAVSRLCWMQANLKLIPEGHDIDHKKGTDIPFPHAYSNLRLRDSHSNRANFPFEEDEEFL